MIDVSDLFKLAADLERGTARLEPESRAIVRKSTANVKRDARTRCPVATGELRDSIGAAVDGLEGTVTAGTDHAEYVEDGTSVMAPQPFMGPALSSNAPVFIAGFERVGASIL